MKIPRYQKRLLMYAITAARALLAQRWKMSKVPTKEDWQLKLMEYVLLADLTYRIREQEEYMFREDWKMFIEY